MKELTRERVVKARASLSHQERERLGSQVVSRLRTALTPMESSGSLKGLKIALYKSTGGEVSLRPLKRWLAEQGAALFFPRVTDRSLAVMEMARVEKPEDPESWIRGAFRIFEPVSTEIADPAELDLIVVPGVAFDSEGHRMGWGAGYYDRYLVNAVNALRVALAYDLQVEPEGSPLARDEWDQPVDWILTEKRDIRTPRVASWRQRRRFPAFAPAE